MYPPGWPTCACGQPVLDGHLTCGSAECNEGGARAVQPRPRPPREVIHYGLGITDCGRDGASLPPSHKWTMTRAIVTCGECIDARAHLEAKLQKGSVH